MSWHGIEGHDRVVELFRRALARRRLASSFLFAGPPGIGKATFARKLAQVLLCETRPEEAMDPCETCPACAQVKIGSHPDFIVIAKPPERTEIPVATFIGPDKNRMREGLIHDLSLRPSMGGRKVAIIDDADVMNEEGANALLKTLEEPPPKSVLILVGTSAAKQLPTIRSRCQLVRFHPLAPETIARLLVAQGLADDPAWARRLGTYGEGSLTRAADLADPALWAFREKLFAHLGHVPLESVALASAVAAFVDQAGKEAGPRRHRLRTVLGLALGFYRALLRILGDAPADEDADLHRAALAVAHQWPGDVETAGGCIERTLDALEQVDRMAYLPVVIEAWAEELAMRSAR